MNFEEKWKMESKEGWYRVINSDIAAAGGSGLLRHYYADSISQAVAEIFPEHSWHSWKFRGGVPNKFWTSLENRVNFFNSIAKEAQVENLEDWYRVERASVDKLGGGGLLAVYGDSLAEALQKTFPSHHWLPWRFAGVPRGFWTHKSNRRQFFLFLADKQDLSQSSQWYEGITMDLVEAEGGISMLSYFNGSLYQAIADAFPEYQWEPWRFSCTPKHLLSKLSSSDLVKFVQFVEEKLRITSGDQWTRVSWAQLKAVPAASCILTPSGAAKFAESLTKVHPTLRLEHSIFAVSAGKNRRQQRKAAQSKLRSVVSSLFPSEEVLEEQRVSPVQVEVDILVPSLSLAFEYQGEQHFQQIHNASQEDQDAAKAAILSRHSLSLVEVPYCWDGHASSLSLLILSVRPDMAHRLK